MPKKVTISFPKDGTHMEFLIPDEVVRNLARQVVNGEHSTLPQAFTDLVYDALNYNNETRQSLHYPVDYPYPLNKCPVCKEERLELVHPNTAKLGYYQHCANCFYTFKQCKQCHSGLIYMINREIQEKIHVMEYCTQCDYEHKKIELDNFQYIDLYHEIFHASKKN